MLACLPSLLRMTMLCLVYVNSGDSLSFTALIALDALNFDGQRHSFPLSQFDGTTSTLLSLKKRTTANILSEMMEQQGHTVAK